MGTKPLRRCAYPGCTMLTDSGYCQTHKPKQKRAASASWHWMYRAPQLHWPERREAQLIAEPFCRECARRGLRVPATDADHVIPHRGDVKLFTTGELQSLCHSCHARKTMQENAQRTAAEKRKNRR